MSYTMAKLTNTPEMQEVGDRRYTPSGFPMPYLGHSKPNSTAPGARLPTVKLITPPVKQPENSSEPKSAKASSTDASHRQRHSVKNRQAG